MKKNTKNHDGHGAAFEQKERKEYLVWNRSTLSF
jgi:hypothetical protein